MYVHMLYVYRAGSLIPGGKWISYFDQSEITEHIVHFYYRLFTKQFNWRPKLEGLAFDSTLMRRRPLG